MPKRSTPFQKLVDHIQRHLSPDHSVEESAMLRHRVTGTDREVDIVIRSQVGEHRVVISIECIDHDRPADVTWVEQMKAKHEHLPTGHLLLVSRSGFYGPALLLAAQSGIGTYTPEEVVAEDWTQIVGKMDRLFVARFDFTPLSCELTVRTDDGTSTLPAGEGTELYRTSGERLGTLQEMLMALLSTNRTFASQAMSGIVRDGHATLACDFTPQQVVALDMAGRRHPVVVVRAHVHAARATGPIDLASMSWRGLPAAVGGGTTPLGDTTITILEPVPGSLDATVTVDGKDIRAYAPDTGFSKATSSDIPSPPTSGHRRPGEPG